MEQKTGIFITERQFVAKSGTEAASERDLDYVKRLVEGLVAGKVAGIGPGRLFVVAIADLDVADWGSEIKIEQQVLIALLDYADAEVGDCVVWGDEKNIAFEVVPGEIWHYAPYGIFPALGRFYKGNTHLKIFQRVD